MRQNKIYNNINFNDVWLKNQQLNRLIYMYLYIYIYELIREILILEVNAYCHIYKLSNHM